MLDIFVFSNYNTSNNAKEYNAQVYIYFLNMYVSAISYFTDMH